MKRNNTNTTASNNSSSSSLNDSNNDLTEKEPLTKNAVSTTVDIEEETPTEDGDTLPTSTTTKPNTKPPTPTNEKYKEYPIFNNKLLCTIKTKYSYYQQKQMFQRITTFLLIFLSFYCGILYDSKVIPPPTTTGHPVVMQEKSSNLRLGAGGVGGGVYGQEMLEQQQQQMTPEENAQAGVQEGSNPNEPQPQVMQQPNAVDPNQQQQPPVPPEQQQQQQQQQQQTGEMPVQVVPFDPNQESNVAQQQQQEQTAQAMEEAKAAAIASEIPPEAAQPGQEAVVPPPQLLENQPPPPPQEPTNADSTPNNNNNNPDLSALQNYKDIWEPTEPSDNAVFFHLPKAGGSTIKDIMGTCHRFVMASQFGVMDGHDQDTEIAVVYPANGSGEPGRTPFVNVDTISVAGIQRAASLGFAASGLADATVITRLYDSNALFTPTAKGRLFTVFRHPIDRTISMFYYIQIADWEPTYNPELQDWTIEQYAQSEIIENNYYTRVLTNKPEGELTDEDLKVAMEVVRRKLLIGLMDQMDRTMDRIERFFKWTYHVMPENQEKCRVDLLSGGSNRNSDAPDEQEQEQQQQPKQKKFIPKEGSEAYELLRWQNVYDLKLYAYIESVFEQQEVFMKGIPSGFRNVGATCCKCTPPTYPPEGFTCPVNHADAGEEGAAAGEGEGGAPPPPPPLEGDGGAPPPPPLPEENGQNPSRL